jgi:hypothetical protein
MVERADHMAAWNVVDHEPPSRCDALVTGGGAILVSDEGAVHIADRRSRRQH